MQEQIRNNFQILRDSIDVGTLTEGESKRIEVPIKYTGDLPISLEVSLPNPFVDLEFTQEPITSSSKNFILLVRTENSEGSFTLPLPLTIRYENVTIEERTVVVKGNVFVPLAFRQFPPNGPIEFGRDFSVFIRNNTDETVEIGLILVDAKLDIAKRPDRLLPHEEGEVVFKTRPVDPPAQMYVTLKTPLHGRDTFTYRFRNGRP